jgi:hypothetical protein
MYLGNRAVFEGFNLGSFSNRRVLQQSSIKIDRIESNLEHHRLHTGDCACEFNCTSICSAGIAYLNSKFTYLVPSISDLKLSHACAGSGLQIRALALRRPLVHTLDDWIRVQQVRDRLGDF